MKLESFQCLEMIKQCGTIATAAQQLHMSRQGLYTIINQLEAELGVSLITRKSRGVVLSEEGKQACEIAKTCLRQLHQLKLTPAITTGHLRLGGTQMVLNSWLTEPLSAFHLDYPLITLKTDISDVNDIVAKYTAHEIDLGFIALSQEKIELLERHRPQLQVVVFDHYNIGVCISHTSPWAKQKFISLEHLKNAQIIYNCTEEHAAKQVQYELFQPSNQSKTIFEPIHSVYEKMIANGIGVGITPIVPSMTGIKTITASTASDPLLFVPFQDAPRQYVAYLTDSTTPFSPEAVIFLNLLTYLSPEGSLAPQKGY